jgi:ATP-dependent DNA ligase
MGVQSFVEVIKACEITNKREPKMEALRTLDYDGQNLVKEALDPYRVFGIKKWPKIKNYSETDAHVDVFFGLLNQLHDRQLTGNAARDAVVLTLSSFTEESARYLARILDKNLKCGITETTVNKIFPELVPTFEVMLAEKVDAKYKFFFPCQAEYKMDGARLIAICDHGNVSYFSRAGKPSDFCKGLFDDDLIDLERYIGTPFIMDGEVLGDNFVETINAKSEDNNEAKQKLNFYVFDMMTLSEWEKQKCGVPQWKRSQFIVDCLRERDYKKIIKSRQKTCHSMEQLREFYQQALSDGFEGLIIKDPEGLYEFGRSKSWTKWKPIIDVDLTITGIYEGKAGTKNEGKLGGFNVSGYDENGNYIETNVGSLKLGTKGCPLDVFIQQLIKDNNLPTEVITNELVFNEKSGEYGIEPQVRQLSNDEIFRSYVFEHPEEFISRTLQIEAQELSMADGRPDVFSLRFPVAVMIRDDK